MKFERTKLYENVYFNVYKDEKFKTNTISIRFLSPISRERVSKNALLASVMGNSQAAYPSLREQTDKLADLYGAEFDAYIEKPGEWQNLCFNISGIANKFTLAGEDLLSLMAEFILGAIFKPNTTDSAFRKADLKLAKPSLRDDILSEINDKRRFANSECIRAMCSGENFAIPRLGFVEDIDKISGRELYENYLYLLKTCNAEVFFTGPGDEEKLKKIMMESFAGFKSRGSAPPVLSVGGKRKEALLIEKKANIKQGKLVLGYFFPPAKTLKEEVVATIFVNILGGGMNSKLFKNLREKKSLCYYSSAQMNYLRGIILLFAGVEFAKMDEASKEMILQVENMTSGMIDESEIAIAKKASENSLKRLGDTPAISEFYFSGIIKNILATPKEYIAAFEDVSAKELVEFAKTLVLDTDFRLLGEGKSNE